MFWLSAAGIDVTEKIHVIPSISTHTASPISKNLMLIFAKKSYFFLNANAIIKKIAVNSKLSDTISF